MTGGLIQIASQGTQDLYLTGVPEITFFKVVYRRHTVFSTEHIRIGFDDKVGFGRESTLNIPKLGDLIHKMYVEVTIPEMALKRNISNVSSTDKNTAYANYIKAYKFMKINLNAYRAGYDQYIASNVTTAEPIITDILEEFATGDTTVISNFQSLLATNSSFVYEQLNMKSVADSYNNTDSKEEIYQSMSGALYMSKLCQKYYFDEYIAKKTIYDDNTNDNLNFAWVPKLGHVLLNNIELSIGGRVIDRQYGEWLNIWREVTNTLETEDLFNEMIGNISSLTTFDRTTKPQYTMYIPLNFWFCKYSGLALPLVALQYHNVNINVKFRNLEDVSYMENGQQIYIAGLNDELYLYEYVNETGNDITANIIIEYVFLDTNERRRFAQSSHEYLIEEIQINEFDYINQKDYIAQLSFFHPIKEMYWIAQPTSYTNNQMGYTKTQYLNYGINTDETVGTIKYSSLDFNSYKRIVKLDRNYYNYVQPYGHHLAIPQDGINNYCFCLYPEEHQPSGGPNLSKIKRLNLQITFDDTLYPNDQTITEMRLKVYVINYNILRIMSGLGSTAFASH